ncbi:MAG TPA: PD-(D/E)XK nuclease family protein [Coriobacteriia bacterium]
MSVFSHSRIESYETCPKKYEFSYLIKPPKGPDGIEAFMGSRVHDALEWLYGEVKACRAPDEEDLVERFRQVWDAEWEDDIRIVRPDRTADDYRAIGEKALRDYYRRYHPFDQAVTVGLELRVTLPLDEDHQIVGYIDRLDRVSDGVWEIHDYKTAATLMTQDKADANRQLALYELAIRQMYSDVREVTLVWHYLALDCEVRSSRAPEQLANLRAQVLESVKHIEAQHSFLARTSNLCDWCEYRPLCPAWKHLYQTDALPEGARAEEPGVVLIDEYLRISDEMAALKARQDELKDAIATRAAADGVDRLFGTGGSLKVFRYASIGLPDAKDPRRSELEAELRAMGLWERFSALASYPLSRAIGDGALAPDQLEQLEPFVTRCEGVKLYPARNR